MKNKLALIWGILVVGFCISLFSRFAPSADPAYRSISIEDQVAQNAVKEYQIAAREGDLLQMYTQAGFCSAAFLQAHDEENYRKWKAIEHQLAAQLHLRVYH